MADDTPMFDEFDEDEHADLLPPDDVLISAGEMDDPDDPADVGGE